MSALELKKSVIHKISEINEIAFLKAIKVIWIAGSRPKAFTV